MKKEEHNLILKELLEQVDLNDLRGEVVRMSHLIAKGDQLDLMGALMMRIPYKSPDYERLNAQVDKAVADSKKERF